jgi:hypothetical protein
VERNILLVLGCCVLVICWVHLYVADVDGVVKVGDTVEVLARGEHKFVGP